MSEKQLKSKALFVSLTAYVLVATTGRCVAFSITNVGAPSFALLKNHHHGKSQPSPSLVQHNSNNNRMQPQGRKPFRLHATSVTDDMMVTFRDVVGQSKASLPIYEEELVTADSDSVVDAMQSSDRVRVFREKHKFAFWRTKFIGFEPVGTTTKRDIGFILYPGAFVDAEAYTPIARSMADLGYYTAVTVPPLELSLTDVDLADDVIKYWGDKVKTWVIGGHSMGGVVAAAYAKDYIKTASQLGSNKLKGIILLASYPSDGRGFLQGDLSSSGPNSASPLATVSCYGSLDGLATPEEIETNKKLLPANTVFCRIEGGNHSQFYYGTKLQKGDNPASITIDEQQEAARQALLGLLRQISADDQATVATKSTALH